MTELQIDQQVDSLDSRFSGMVRKDPRAGYSGYLVTPDALTAFAGALRDELGFRYLSSLTAVDYLAEDLMEVVYHAYRLEGGPALAFKAQVPRQDPRLPSLVPLFPGAEFQEREAWDLFGIRFDGHPDLRRILMWEGFHGHPMRKDWREAYFEEESKPFKNRWPEGKVHRIEDKVAFGHNVNYPPDFSPEGWVPDGDAALYAGLGKIHGNGNGKGAGLETEQIVVNLGPQHPSTHGVFRMVAQLDGETVVDLRPVMGYLHRNHEKIGERNTFLMNMPFTDRLDYFCSMGNNFGYALAVEKLMGIRPP
jgi:NADH-quinone oxidoreductase subunit D/NADH-quinone oxidoreductase subunit C/D